MKLDKLTFHRRWSVILTGLSDAERLEVYDAIVKYGLDFEEGTFHSVTARMAFGLIRSEIDAEIRHRHEVLKVKRRAGKLGGRPKVQSGKPPDESRENIPAESATTTHKPQSEPVPPPPAMEGLFGEVVSVRPEKQKPLKHRYAPYVLLTEAEYNALANNYGETGARWMIDKLDGYKAARGMTYKSDYRAILNWVVKEYRKEATYGNTTTDRQSGLPTAKQQRDYEFASYVATKLGGADAPEQV